MKIWAKTKEFCEGKFLVVRRDGTVPHWPHFVLGARDPAAASALRGYADVAAALNFEPDYVASIRELSLDFDRYRAAHGNGDPESPPHRKDDPKVIAAMRGHEASISVKPDMKNELTPDRSSIPRPLVIAGLIEDAAKKPPGRRRDDFAEILASEDNRATILRALRESAE